MSVELRLPNIKAEKDTDKILQMQSYLYQLVQQLNYSLNVNDEKTTETTSNETTIETKVVETVSWATITGKPSTFPPSVHTHDDRYYTESEVDTLLSSKAASVHNHDDRYYTETETDTLLSAKENTSNKVVSISSSSTDTQYPSAKCVYDAIFGAMEGSY